MKKRTQTQKQIAVRAAQHHSNLNAFAAVVILLESGLVYGSDNFRASETIIRIAKQVQQKELKRYDSAIAKLKEAS